MFLIAVLQKKTFSPQTSSFNLTNFYFSPTLCVRAKLQISLMCLNASIIDKAFIFCRFHTKLVWHLEPGFDFHFRRKQFPILKLRENAEQPNFSKLVMRCHHIISHCLIQTHCICHTQTSASTSKPERIVRGITIRLLQSLGECLSVVWKNNSKHFRKILKLSLLSCYDEI